MKQIKASLSKFALAVLTSYSFALTAGVAYREVRDPSSTIRLLLEHFLLIAIQSSFSFLFSLLTVTLTLKFARNDLEKYRRLNLILNPLAGLILGSVFLVIFKDGEINWHLVRIGYWIVILNAIVGFIFTLSFFSFYDWPWYKKYLRLIPTPQSRLARFIELSLFLALNMYISEKAYWNALLNSNFAVLLYVGLFFIYSFFRLMPKKKSDILKTALAVTTANLLYFVLSSYLFKYPIQNLPFDPLEVAFRMLPGIIPTFLGTLLVQWLLFKYVQVTTTKRQCRSDLDP